jgi:aminoglycoside phosphotransferase (APT) family kinase protein
MDIEQASPLIDYLRATQRIGPAECPSIEILAGGVSNRTVLVRRTSGPDWVIKQALAKLRVQVDWFSSPERVHREALGMQWLNRLAPPGTVTPLVFEDHDEHLVCMEAVPRPHDNWKTLLLAGDVRTDHIRQFGHLLGTIHRRSAEQADELAALFDDRAFFESLRLEPYYVYSAEQVPGAARFLEQLLLETRGRRQCLVHGDYSPKNVLVYQDRLVLLDHEVIHWGDPAFDLGFSLTHLLSKAYHLPQHRAAFAHAACDYWQSYRAALGDVSWREGLEERAVRQTLGCLLARVAGRSPLEYLSQDQRVRQQSVVVELMQKPPGTILALTRSFLAALAS